MRNLNLKNQFHRIKINFVSFLTNTKKKVFVFKCIDIKQKKIVIVVSGILLVSVLIILFNVNSETTKTDIPNKYVFEDDLIPPLEPQSISSYLLNRETPKEWSQEESEDFFTTPDGDFLQQIQLSNDRLITNVLKDAP